VDHLDLVDQGPPRVSTYNVPRTHWVESVSFRNQQVSAIFRSLFWCLFSSLFVIPDLQIINYILARQPGDVWRRNLRISQEVRADARSYIDALAVPHDPPVVYTDLRDLHIFSRPRPVGFCL
jgi:hypothetical protein